MKHIIDKLYNTGSLERDKCCDAGYGLDFRTLVLQGSEDGYFTDERSTL